MPVRLNADKEYVEALNRIRGVSEFPTPAAITPIDLKRPMRLAIGSLGRSNDEQNGQLEDLVLTDLTGAQGLELVERRSLDKVLQELNLSISHLVRAQDAVRAGKLLKADWFLLGTEANINGTNFIVVRLVDSHTGIMRDAGVFSTDGSPVKLAADIAGFVRQCRLDAAAPKPKVYLAIGTFRDLSLNNRQAAFPAQLHAYLTAAYQGTNVTLLEREAAEVLFQEMRLDFAGLTAGEGTNAPVPMQSAYWLVDGDYQSYETTNYEVELSLNIGRILGRWTVETLRGRPDERLFQKIKGAIDTRMKQDTSLVATSLRSEAMAQLSAGNRLANFGQDIFTRILTDSSANDQLDPQEFARHRRNAEEAIHAFETVLLLEPKNREAKIDLAAFLRGSNIGRVDEARNLYREVLEEPIQDQWDRVAELALVNSFLWSDPSEEARWFAAAIQHNTNSALDEFYRKNAESATRNATIENGGDDAVNQAQKRLLETIRSNKNVLDGKSGTDYFDFGMSQFPGAFRDKAAAATAMADFLPQLESEFPELAPHLTAAALSLQVDTNSPVVAEFQKQLEWCLTHTNQIYHPERYWALVAHAQRNSADDWLFTHHLYALALETVEGYRATAGQNFGDEDDIALGFAYMKVERWKEALEIFDGFGRTPVLMTTDGPWGNRWQPVLTSEQAAYCREKLGLPVMREPGEFLMGRTPVALCDCSTFAADETGLWVATGNQLLRLDFELKTNLVVNLPKDADNAITTLDIGKDNIWIGTEGNGLIEIDKASKQCRRLTVEDGLMMNEICSTRLSGDALWIGYGYKFTPEWGSREPEGGIGFMNLSSHQFVSFTLPLKDSPVVEYQTPANQPPRNTVTAIAAGISRDIWFFREGASLRRYQSESNTWGEFPVSSGCCLAANSEQLYCGHFDYFPSKRSGSFGVDVVNLHNDGCRPLKITGPFPANSVSALALAGNDLWVGGMGYIALIDPNHDQLKNFAFIQAPSVAKIQIAGGYVWAQYNGYLYRAPLGDSQEKYFRSQLAQLVPFQFQKDTNGAAVLQRLHVRENTVERDGMNYCGFKFTIPAWTDGNLKLMYIMAKIEAEKDFGGYMVSQIISENGPSAGSYGYLRESLTNYPQLKLQFPYTKSMTTQIFDIKRLEPGKTYGIWFEFDNKSLPDIAFAMTVNSPRGTNEFGILPLR